MKRFRLVVLLVAAMVVCGTVAAFARSPQTYTYVLVPTSSAYSNPNAGGALTVTVEGPGTEWREDYYGNRKKVKFWWLTWDFDVWGLAPDTGHMFGPVYGYADESGSYSETYSGKVYVKDPPDGSDFSVLYYIYPGGWWIEVLVTAD